MSRDRSTHQNFEKFYEKFPAKNAWNDLKEKARLQARKTEVEFMCISEAEGNLLGQLGNFLSQGKPQKWVEVGALTGFSALCLMSALPKGSELWTCELSPERSNFLRELFNDSRIGGKIHVVEGDSKITVNELTKNGPFDGIFIDGAKTDYLNNLDWAEKNLKPGGYVLADNIFLNGDLYAESNKRNQVMEKFVERLGDPKIFRSVLLPNTDGLWLAQFLG